MESTTSRYQITKFRDDFAKETNASNERIRKARDAGNKQLLDKTVADEKAAATARMQNEISAVQTELAERQKWQKEYEQHPGRMAHPLQDAPIKALQGVLEALNQTLDHTVLGFDNLAASETKAGLDRSELMPSGRKSGRMNWPMNSNERMKLLNAKPPAVSA